MNRYRYIARCSLVFVALLVVGLVNGASRSSSAATPVTAASQTLAAAPSNPGALISVPPARIADSRIRQQIAGAIPGLGTVSVKVTGQGGVPAVGVATAVLTVTIASPQSSGHITAWPTGRPKPNTSNLNFTAGIDIATSTIVPVGADGAIQLFNGAPASTDMVIDVIGYTLAGAPSSPGALVSVTPTRIADSRLGLQITRTVPSFATVPVQVTGFGGVPRTGVAAAVLTVTVAQPQSAGYVTVWPGGVARTNTSPLSFTAGNNIATTTLAPVGRDGSVQLLNGSAGSAELIVDVIGYTIDGTLGTSGALAAATPARIADSRLNQQISGPVGGAATVSIGVAGFGPVPSRDVAAVVLTVTVVPRGTGYISIWPAGAARPATSTLNFTAGTNISTTSLVAVGSTGKVNLANTGSGSVDLIVDVVGYTLADTAVSDAPTAFNAGVPRPDRDPTDPAFTIAVMPDTQQEVFSPGQRFKNRSDWLVSQSGPRALDLRFVTHTGDVVNWDTEDHAQYAWASQALQPLTDAGIPWSLSNGNHDNEATGPGGGARDSRNTRTLFRDTTTWNSYFTAERYGAVNGAFERGKTDNIYSEFYAGGKRWMVLNLEMWPRVAVVNWARQVVADHPRDNIVVVTHSYLTQDGSIHQQAEYGSTSPQYLYDNLISRYPNIKMVFSGHVGIAASRTDVGVYGNTIYSFVAAIHSSSTNPVRLVTINTAAGTIQSRIVAPWNNATDWVQYNLDISGVSWIS